MDEYEPCGTTPILGPSHLQASPPAQAAATVLDGYDQGRQGSPMPGFTYQVQLLGGEAGCRLAQEHTEAVAAVLAWLAVHPPTLAAAAGSAATGAIGKPSGGATATLVAGMWPVRPTVVACVDPTP